MERALTINRGTTDHQAHYRNLHGTVEAYENVSLGSREDNPLAHGSQPGGATVAPVENLQLAFFIMFLWIEQLFNHHMMLPVWHFNNTRKTSCFQLTTTNSSRRSHWGACEAANSPPQVPSMILQTRRGTSLETNTCWLFTAWSPFHVGQFWKGMTLNRYKSMDTILKPYGVCFFPDRQSSTAQQKNLRLNLHVGTENLKQGHIQSQSYPNLMSIWIKLDSTVAPRTVPRAT